MKGGERVTDETKCRNANKGKVEVRAVTHNMLSTGLNHHHHPISAFFPKLLGSHRLPSL